MLTTQAINDFKDFVTRSVSYAQVTVNGSVTKKIIQRKERMANGKVAIYVPITPQLSTTANITKVQLYNTANKLWAEKTCNISLKSVQEGVLCRFVFDFVEKEE